MNSAVNTAWNSRATESVLYRAMTYLEEVKKRFDSPFALEDRGVLMPPGGVRLTRKHHVEEAANHGFLDVDFGLGDEFGEGFGLKCVVADPSKLSILRTQ